jgi:CRISPR-associated protein Csd2
MSESNSTLTRGTGLLIIEVENSNPNGDPDQESDPRRRSHDQRGMITGVSFKRKLRDLVLRKDGQVWPKIACDLGIRENAGTWSLNGLQFDVLESREHDRGSIARLLNEDFEGFKKRFWDSRVFGNTFLEEGGGDTIRSGVAHFGLGISVAPVRIHRLTKTKLAPAESGREGEAGPTRGMAPLAHRVVEHGVYCMPFFVNPTGARGRSGTGCTRLDINLLFRLLKYGYPHTKSDIRPLVEVRHAWYAEHDDDLGSFSEFEFIGAMTPTRKGDSEKPSTGQPPKLKDQYDLPPKLPDSFRGKLKNDRLFDLCIELPDWCSNSCKGGGDGGKPTCGA